MEHGLSQEPLRLRVGDDQEPRRRHAVDPRGRQGEECRARRPRPGEAPRPGDVHHLAEVPVADARLVEVDEDGVADKDDDCPGTIKGTTVNSHGCPVDTDGDGIPDFKDKEPNSVKGATVDANGVTITDQAIPKKTGADSLATDRNQLFKQNPSLAYLKGVESQIKQERKSNPGKKTSIPENLKIADKNKDGLITTNEITDAIDAFFDGNTALSIDKINSLIDYFFEQ